MASPPPRELLRFGLWDQERTTGETDPMDRQPQGLGSQGAGRHSSQVGEGEGRGRAVPATRAGVPHLHSSLLHSAAHGQPGVPSQSQSGGNLWSPQMEDHGATVHALEVKPQVSLGGGPRGVPSSPAPSSWQPPGQHPARGASGPMELPLQGPRAGQGQPSTVAQQEGGVVQGQSSREAQQEGAEQGQALRAAQPEGAKEGSGPAQGAPTGRGRQEQDPPSSGRFGLLLSQQGAAASELQQQIPQTLGQGTAQDRGRTPSIPGTDPWAGFFARDRSGRGGQRQGMEAVEGEEAGAGGNLTLSRYESQKKRDWNTFGQYLRNHYPPIPLSKCTSQNVVDFMKYLDQFGKTKVHEQGCRYFGAPGACPCACPMKQAWGSLDALIGRLRAAYEEHGGDPETNPFAHKLVRVHLREVRDFQSKARGVDYDKKKRKRAMGALERGCDGRGQGIALGRTDGAGAVGGAAGFPEAGRAWGSAAAEERGAAAPGAPGGGLGRSATAPREALQQQRDVDVLSPLQLGSLEGPQWPHLQHQQKQQQQQQQPPRLPQQQQQEVLGPHQTQQQVSNSHHLQLQNVPQQSRQQWERDDKPWDSTSRAQRSRDGPHKLADQGAEQAAKNQAGFNEDEQCALQPQPQRHQQAVETQGQPSVQEQGQPMGSQGQLSVQEQAQFSLGGQGPAADAGISPSKVGTYLSEQPRSGARPRLSSVANHAAPGVSGASAGGVSAQAGQGGQSRADPWLVEAVLRQKQPQPQHQHQQQPQYQHQHHQQQQLQHQQHQQVPKHEQQLQQQRLQLQVQVGAQQVEEEAVQELQGAVALPCTAHHSLAALGAGAGRISRDVAALQEPCLTEVRGLEKAPHSNCNSTLSLLPGSTASSPGLPLPRGTGTPLANEVPQSLPCRGLDSEPRHEAQECLQGAWQQGLGGQPGGAFTTHAAADSLSSRSAQVGTLQGSGRGQQSHGEGQLLSNVTGRSRVQGWASSMPGDQQQDLLSLFRQHTGDTGWK